MTGRDIPKERAWQRLPLANGCTLARCTAGWKDAKFLPLCRAVI